MNDKVLFSALFLGAGKNIVTFLLLSKEKIDDLWDQMRCLPFFSLITTCQKLSIKSLVGQASQVQRIAIQIFCSILINCIEIPIWVNLQTLRKSPECAVPKVNHGDRGKFPSHLDQSYPLESNTILILTLSCVIWTIDHHHIANFTSFSYDTNFE